MDIHESRKALMSTKKYWDTTNFGAPVSTGTWYPLNIIPFGTDNNRRIGRVFNNKTLHIKVFTGPDSGTPIIEDQIVRVMVVYDRTAILSIAPIDLLVVNNVLAMYNFNQTERFLVLMDKLFFCDRRNTTAGSILASSYIHYYHEEIIPIDLSTIVGNVSAINTGHLWCYVLGTNPTSGLRTSILTRLYFEDE